MKKSSALLKFSRAKTTCDGDATGSVAAAGGAAAGVSGVADGALAGSSASDVGLEPAAKRAGTV